MEAAMKAEFLSVVVIALLHFTGYGLIALLLIRAGRKSRRKADKAQPDRSWRQVFTAPKVVAHLCLLLAATTEITVVLAVHLPHAAPPVVQAA
jgi:hypothetical protein